VGRHSSTSCVVGRLANCNTATFDRVRAGRVLTPSQRTTVGPCLGVARVGDLIQTTAGKWIIQPPIHCPNGHTLTPGRMLVGFQRCGGAHAAGIAQIVAVGALVACVLVVAYAPPRVVPPRTCWWLDDCPWGGPWPTYSPVALTTSTPLSTVIGKG
jgi:hypothetical protein